VIRQATVFFSMARWQAKVESLPPEKSTPRFTMNGNEMGVKKVMETS
jgi:hypothetical protein